MQIVNAAHLHLVLNHLPIVGVLFVIPWLLYGLAFKNKSITRASLLTLIAVALLSIPTYLTGEGAEEIVEKLPNVSEAYIEKHEELAGAALFFSLTLGLFALITLVLSLKGSKKQGALGLLTFLLTLFSAGVLILTANYGGKIKHTEIRVDQILKPYEED